VCDIRGELDVQQRSERNAGKDNKTNSRGALKEGIKNIIEKKTHKIIRDDKTNTVESTEQRKNNCVVDYYIK